MDRVKNGGVAKVKAGFSQQQEYSQICPNSHLPLTVICLVRPVCLYLQDILYKTNCPNQPCMSYPATDFWFWSLWDISTMAYMLFCLGIAFVFYCPL
jgi:hypothetical protein